jgi:hypothetical protein
MEQTRGSQFFQYKKKVLDEKLNSDNEERKKTENMWNINAKKNRTPEFVVWITVLATCS